MNLYECAVCKASWVQVRGSDPQTHKQGCPNARPGDLVSLPARDGTTPADQWLIEQAKRCHIVAVMPLRLRDEEKPS